MLVRAARRKALPAALRSRISSEELYLPWLCPAYTSIQGDKRRWFSVDAIPPNSEMRKRRSSQDASTRPSRRSLATAVSYGLEDIPFEHLGTMPPASRSRMQDGLNEVGNYSHLLPLEPTTTRKLFEPIRAPKRVNYNFKMGFGGEVGEVTSVFDACLQIGKIERAGIILQRIAATSLDQESLLALHNRYLRAAVEQIMMNPHKAEMESLHKWFQLEIRRKNLPMGAEMIAYMVKASLQSPRGPRARLVQRYMDMLDEEGALNVFQAEILTAAEINDVTHLYPKYNFTDELMEDLVLEDDDLAEVDGQVGQDRITPEVKSTRQRGLGLISLKRSLSLFSSLPGQGIDIPNASPEMRRDIQARIEEDSVRSAIDRWREEHAHLVKMGLNSTLQTKSLGARMWKWQMALEKQLKEEFVKINDAENAEKRDVSAQDRCLYGPFLRILPVEKLAAVTILSCMSTLSSMGVDKGVTLAHTIMTIAGSVEDESIYEIVQRNTRNKVIWPRSKKYNNAAQSLTPELIKKATRGRAPGSVSRFARQYVKPDGSPIEVQWPLTVKAKVGAFLMSALIEIAKVPVTLKHPDTKEVVTQMQPALSHSHQYRLGKKIGVIIANKSLVQQLKREPVHSLLAKHLPMLVTPNKWTHFNKGGFITYPSKMMRIKGDKDQRHYAEAAIGQGDMIQTFRGLDVLGKTPWRINKGVFDVMLQAWNSGEAIANIPSETPNLEMPPEPITSTDPAARRRWMRAVKAVENTRSGLHSQRCFQNFQLEIARALRNEEFFFPHNVDFRGRAYPIPPYLNHIGADHCRGILMFGEGKELGESGLKWLKIQLANVFGFDKASLSEREQFAVDHLDDVYDSASNPLGGNRWWLQAEDPWQCLAACIELKNAIESGDPTQFVSHLPVHQDGTCNGLQHYAALGGDIWGAKQVNLEPGDRPADVYSAVANLVKESIAQDHEKGNPYAAILHDKITRKVVKQTVMTNVYGVTYVGAKAQVRKQLVAAYPDLPNNEQINPGVLSSYIATKIFTSLSTMFRGAHDIQYWLHECANRITSCLTKEQLARLESDWPKLHLRAKVAKDAGGSVVSLVDELVQFKSSVIWTNPLNMPVVQPYRSSRSKTIVTNMQHLSLSEPHRSDPVSKRKQLQGFPPNFIHSLDATHMLLSALRCDELGISFAAVHDSFWTHAKDIDAMNGVLRDAFIRIHTEDVIGRLAAEFSARYKGGMYLARIQHASKLYGQIIAWRASDHAAKNEFRNAPKSKKAPHLEELRLEYERMKLLRSENPVEVEKGRNMVTPGSLFAEMASDEDLVDGAEFADMGLGDISPREARLSADQEITVGDPDNIEEINNPLPGGTAADAAMRADAENIPEEDLDVDLVESSAEPEEVQNRFARSLGRPTKRQMKKSVQIWLPLTFPPVPKKGDFDVTRLKDSKYFFS